ncbi:MAG: peptide chain release factor N(5)-glutamine methyltransferase, partial [Burkholderiaceae bacterium]
MLLASSRVNGGRAWIRANSDFVLSPIEVAKYFEMCERRLAGEPLAYITGSRGFYGLELAIDARVLDPRPDTETLVDWALDVIRGQHGPRVLDLGTGSGAIALAIQHQKRDAKVWASDASADALDVARANAARLGLPIQFQLGSWLAPLLAANADTVGASHQVEPSCAHPTFDLIVSNPPYIAEGDPHLPALTHEPIGALTSGPDGLRDIRQIVQQSPACLKAGGWLLLEHGHDQAGAVTDILHTGGFTHIQSRKDLAGIERCTGGQWLPMASGG